MNFQKALNIIDFHNTLDVVKRGYYEVNGKRNEIKPVRSTEFKYRKDFIKSLSVKNDIINKGILYNPKISINDLDSFGAAQKNFQKNPNIRQVVLNFANSKIPGGGVSIGALSQEECLCHQSNLYSSITSKDAKIYYESYKKYHPYLSADIGLLSRDVTVFKDVEGNFLENPFTVDVFTVAAPHIQGIKDFEEETYYYDVLQDRIIFIMTILNAEKYESAILGAFGCGAFKNDPLIVAQYFRESITNRCPIKDIQFAILSNSERGVKNFLAFESVFC